MKCHTTDYFICTDQTTDFLFLLLLFFSFSFFFPFDFQLFRYCLKEDKGTFRHRNWAFLPGS